MTQARNKFARVLSSEASRSLGISRQAWHKWVRKLDIRPQVQHARLHYYTQSQVEEVRHAREGRGS
jgi:predicted site-specific integrase-resolvase